MAYVTVKGGERAIDNAHAWLAEERRGDPAVPELSLAQIAGQLGRGGGSRDGRRFAVRPGTRGAGGEAGAGRPDRGCLPAARLPHHAAALRAFACRSIPPQCRCERRISAIFKDLPGGQVLGPTYDYTHRLLDFALAAGWRAAPAPQAETDAAAMPRVSDILGHEGLIEADGAGDDEPGDLTREPLTFPAIARRAPAGSGARRRRLPAGARLFHPARLWRHASVCRRNPHG